MKAYITGANRKVGIASAYSLAKEGIRVIGSDEVQFPFNIHSRNLEAFYINSPCSNKKFYQDLLSVIQKEEPDVLIPVLGTKQVLEYRKDIENYINVLLPEYESFCTVYDKKKTYWICEKTGIAVPKRYSDQEACSILKSEGDTKLVVKPDYDIGGARGLSFIKNIEELNTAINFVQKNFATYVIEEYIPGASSMRAVQLMFSKKKKKIASFILKKIRQWPVTGGVTSFAVSSTEWYLIDFVMPFFDLCPWEGPVEIELIMDQRDGKPKLIEINPRFAGTLAFAIQCGVNFPYILCLAAVNRDCREFNPDYKEGIYYINFSYYLKSILKEYNLQKNKLTFLNQIINELLQEKTGTAPDKKDFPVFLVKGLTELKNKFLNRNSNFDI